MPRPTKASKALTPGEKREVAKEKAKKEVAALQEKARRLKEQLKDVNRATTVSEDDNYVNPKGRVINDADKLEPSVAAAVNENILFKPNDGPQTDFLAAPETDVLYGGAAGGGKSFAMIVDPLRFAHIKDHRALILRKSLPELREIIDKTQELYPQAFPGAKYNATEKVWKFPSGAKLEFGYLDKESDVYRYQGQQYTWIGFDEITHLPTEFPWNYLQSRLRTTHPDIVCYMRCTANPGGVGHEWVKKRYVEPAEWNTGFISDTGITRRFIPASLYDNPYLTQDGNYEKMLKALPEVHRRRLLEGDWDVNEGSAFPEFDKHIHVCPPFHIPPDWNRVKGCDYGYTSPSACVWAAINPESGQVVVYRELYERGLTGEDLQLRLAELEREEHRGIPGVLDTACWNRTGYTGPTIGETLCRGIYAQKFRPADKNRIAGKVQIHEHLKLTEQGEPAMVIFDTCHNLIRELSSIPVSKTNSEDVDTHVDDHAYDALRYLLMSRPRKTPMSMMALEFKQNARFTPSDNTFGY